MPFRRMNGNNGWKSGILRGVQVKNHTYRIRQFEVVLAAWVNLDAGL